MAVFNPGVQSNDPNYLNYPRVLEAPEPDMSRALGIKSLDQALTGTAKFADDAIKQGLSDKAHELVDPERDKLTSGLELLKKQLDTGSIPAPVQNGKPGGSVFDAHAEATDDDLPPGLQSGLDKVDNLSNAYAAGSPKINDTQYSAATLAIAKQLRSQYPGYRDEVDAAVSKASGLPVANSYYQNLMTDINRQLQQMHAKKQADPVGATMLKNMDIPGNDANKDSPAIPNMGALYSIRQNDPERWQKLGGDAWVMEHISDWRSIHEQAAVDKIKRDTSDASDVDKVKSETKNVTKRMNDVVNTMIEQNIALSGMPPLRELTNYFSQVGANHTYEGVPQDATQIAVRQQQLGNYRNLIYQMLKKQSVDSEPTIGAKETEALRQSAMSPIDGYLTLAGGKDANPGVVGLHNRMIQSIKDDDMYHTLINHDTAAVSRMYVTNRGILGDQAFSQFMQNAPPELKEELQGLFKQEQLYAVSGEDPTGAALPQPRHIRDAIEHAKTLKNQSEADIAKQIGGYIGIAQSITNPDLPQAAKDKVIEWAFGAKNRGWIDEIKQDYKDKDGNVVPGKFAAINRMAFPAMSAAVAESAKAMPENYTKYRGAVETEFGAAFRSELGDLNKIIAKPYLNAHFGWDDQTGHFILVDKNNRTILPNYRTMAVENPNQTYLNTAIEKLDRINKLGIDNLVKVFTTDPSPNKGDIGNYLLKTLQTSGFRPGENITNASEGMAKAIIKTKKPEATLEDMDKILGLK